MIVYGAGGRYAGNPASEVIIERGIEAAGSRN
jgi:hypothetical protein